MQLNEEIERKLASQAGNIAPSMKDATVDWMPQLDPAAAPKKLGAAAHPASPRADSRERPTGPLYQDSEAGVYLASDPAMGSGMLLTPAMGEPAQTMHHPVADLLTRGKGYESYDKQPEHPTYNSGRHSGSGPTGQQASPSSAAAPALQQRKIFVPESSVDSDGGPIDPYSAGPAPSHGSRPAHRRNLATAPASARGEEGGEGGSNNFQVSSKLEMPTHATHQHVLSDLSQCVALTLFIHTSRPLAVALALTCHPSLSFLFSEQYLAPSDSDVHLSCVNGWHIAISFQRISME
jgi:hypothetical protein